MNNDNRALVGLVNADVHLVGKQTCQWMDYLKALMLSPDTSIEQVNEAIAAIEDGIQKLVDNDGLQSAIITGQFKAIDDLEAELTELQDSVDAKAAALADEQVQEIMSDPLGRRAAKVEYLVKLIVEHGYIAVKDQQVKLVIDELHEARQDADFYQGYEAD